MVLHSRIENFQIDPQGRTCRFSLGGVSELFCRYLCPTLARKRTAWLDAAKCAPTRLAIRLSSRALPERCPASAASVLAFFRNCVLRGQCHSGSLSLRHSLKPTVLSSMDVELFYCSSF